MFYGVVLVGSRRDHRRYLLVKNDMFMAQLRPNFVGICGTGDIALISPVLVAEKRLHC
jgi:hypothetical protein